MNAQLIAQLKDAIRDRLPFRIGQRGICIEFRHNGFKWMGEIPRASVLLYFSRIRVTDNGDALSCETPGWNPVRVILDDYDVLTFLPSDDTGRSD